MVYKSSRLWRLYIFYSQLRKLLTAINYLDTEKELTSTIGSAIWPCSFQTWLATGGAETNCSVTITTVIARVQ